MIFYALFIIFVNVKSAAYAPKVPAGLERQATSDGTRCSLAPKGGCEQSEGSFPDGT